MGGRGPVPVPAAPGGGQAAETGPAHDPQHRPGPNRSLTTMDATRDRSGSSRGRRIKWWAPDQLVRQPTQAEAMAAMQARRNRGRTSVTTVRTASTTAT